MFSLLTPFTSPYPLHLSCLSCIDFTPLSLLYLIFSSTWSYLLRCSPCLVDSFYISLSPSSLLSYPLHLRISPDPFNLLQCICFFNSLNIYSIFVALSTSVTLPYPLYISSLFKEVYQAFSPTSLISLHSVLLALRSRHWSAQLLRAFQMPRDIQPLQDIPACARFSEGSI